MKDSDNKEKEKKGAFFFFHTFRSPFFVQVSASEEKLSFFKSLFFIGYTNFFGAKRREKKGGGTGPSPYPRSLLFDKKKKTRVGVKGIYEVC